jgi:hypothetical protein
MNPPLVPKYCPFMIEAKFRLSGVAFAPDHATPLNLMHPIIISHVYLMDMEKSGVNRDDDELLSILYCDRAAISVRWEQCQGPSSCVQHTEISGLGRNRMPNVG